MYSPNKSLLTYHFLSFSLHSSSTKAKRMWTRSQDQVCDLKGSGVQVPTCVVQFQDHIQPVRAMVARVSKVRSMGPSQSWEGRATWGLRAKALQSKAGDPHFSLEGGTSAPAQLVSRTKNQRRFLHLKVSDLLRIRNSSLSCLLEWGYLACACPTIVLWSTKLDFTGSQLKGNCPRMNPPGVWPIPDFDIYMTPKFRVDAGRLRLLRLLNVFCMWEDIHLEWDRMGCSLLNVCLPKFICWNPNLQGWWH